MNILKKSILILLLSAVFLFSVLPCAVYATPAHSIGLEFSEADDGKISVSVYIPSPEKLTGIDFSVTLSSENAEIDSFNIKDTDTEKNAVDLDKLPDKAPYNKPYFTYTTAKTSQNLRFSGFFVSSLSSDKDFRLCNIIISKEGELTENDILILSYTINCELCSKTDKQVYSLLKKDISEKENKYSYPAGDADLSGKTDASDARKILRAAVGLDSLSLEELPYANCDYDNKISSSDARYALRVSVGLEKTVMHSFDIMLEDGKKCEDGGNYTFTCKVTGKSFSMEIKNGGHLCRTSHCFSTGKCEVCNEAVKPATGHIYNENGICTVCSASKAELNDITDKLIPLLEEISTYDILADEALQSDKRIDFIRYSQDATKCIKASSELCKNVKGLEQIESHLSQAYKIRFNAFVSVMDDNGEILSTTGNCNIILAAVKQSNKYIDYASYLYE